MTPCNTNGHRRLGIGILVVGAAIVALGGCGTDGNDDAAKASAPTSPTTSEPATSVAATQPSPTSAPATTPASEPTTTEATGTQYESVHFAIPVDLSVPEWLGESPDEDAAGFMTWSATDGERAVRFLSPVAVYPPGSTTAAPLPTDYLTYLLGQADQGGSFTDREETTVDGRPASVLTAATDVPLDGGLGCPDTGISAEDCFGLQPDLVLRIAVIDTGDGPLLVWLRLPADPAPDLAAAAHDLDDLLAGIRFADRSPEAEAATASAIDGVYQWTLTEADARAHGQNPDDSYPWVFTITLDRGVSQLHVDFADGLVPEEHTGTYEVVDNRLTIHTSGLTQSFDFVADADGNLQTTAVLPMDPGDVYVHTSKPWMLIG